MNTQRRTDTRTRSNFRTDRFFCQDGLWYFNTRERTLEGPYATRKAAETYLQTYIALTRISTRLADIELQPTELEAAPGKNHDSRRAKTWDFDPFSARYGSNAA